MIIFILVVFVQVYPRALCVVHLQRNIHTIFKKKHLRYLVSKAARAYCLTDFYTHFNEIKRIDIAFADYLLGIGFEHWARSHFKGARYNVMTNNIAESLNVVLSEAREFPIIPLVEHIRSTLMSWFSIRCDSTSDVTNTLTAKVQDIVANNFEKSTGYGVNRINTHDYEVHNKEEFRTKLIC